MSKAEIESAKGKPEPPPDAPQAPKKPTEGKVISPESPTPKGFVDLDWLNESLRTLQEKGVKAYSNKTILSYLDAITREKNATIAEAVSKLTEAQAAEFVRRVQDTLEMA